MNDEPALTTGTLVAGATVIIGLLVAFGVQLTDVQQKAILAAVAFFAPFIVGIIVRRRVTPNATADDQVLVALQQTPPKPAELEVASENVKRLVAARKAAA